VLIVVAFAGLSGLAPFITIMFLILLSVALQCLALGGMLAILARS
jgi:hypothetical protein